MPIEIHDGSVYTDGYTYRLVDTIYEGPNMRTVLKWAELSDPWAMCPHCGKDLSIEKRGKCLESTFKKWAKTKVLGWAERRTLNYGKT